MNGRPSSQTSASAPTQQAGVQRRPSQGSARGPISTPPRANAQRALRVEITSSTIRSPPVSRMKHGEQHDADVGGTQAAHRSSTYSLVTPGPSANSTPWVPAG